MAISYNTSVVRDGLVFYYDMSNTQKSWRGRPTTNRLVQSVAQFENTSAFNTNDVPGPVTREILVGQGYKGRNAVKIEKGAAASSGYFQIEMSFPGTVTAGQTFTASIKYKRQDASTYFSIGDWGGPDGNNPGWTQILDTDIDDGWRLRVVQRTYTNASSGSFTFGVNSTAPGKWLIFSDFQLEEGTPWSSFTIGTRSNTQAIVDLTNNNTITATSLTYNSDNTFSFDGVSNTLLTNRSVTTTPALSGWTYEVWTRMPTFPTAAPANGSGSTTKKGMLFGATNYAGAGLYWFGNATGTACSVFAYLRGNDAYRNTASFSMATNTWYNFAMVNDYPNAIRFYVNGVEHSTTSCATQEYNSTNVAGAGNIGVSKIANVDGGGTDNYPGYPGQVSVAKIYDRALSATQVRQNFEATRDRYGV